MIAVVIIIYLFPTPQLFNLLLFTQSLSYFKTHKFKSVPKVSIKKLRTLDLKRLKEETVLILRDNRFHMSVPYIRSKIYYIKCSLVDTNFMWSVVAQW